MNSFFPLQPLKSLLPAVCIVLSLTACDSDDTPSVVDTSDVSVLSRSSDTSTSVTIDAATAEYVAVKFSTRPVDGVARQPKTVDNTLAINNSAGIPVMYAVNFTDNNGYTIVSASKATSPIIGFSDQGSYDPSKLNAHSQAMFERLSAKITETFSYPLDSAYAHGSEWITLLPREIASGQRRKVSSSSDAAEIIGQVEVQWAQMGLIYYPISEWLSGNINGSMYYRELPNLDIQLAKLSSVPVEWAGGVPASQLCYIVIQDNGLIETSADKCDPVTTKWTADAPYNSSVPGGKKLSPESVTMGQILHYFNDPSIKLFSRSEDNPLQDNTEISSFLYNVAQNINTVFGSSYSYSSITDITNALSNIYRYSFTLSEPIENGVIESINSGSPVIFFGYGNDGQSYSWICSQYKRVSDDKNYFLMAPLGQPEGIFGPFENCASWNTHGTPNFYFDNSQNDIYFSPFADFENELYTNRLYTVKDLKSK